MQYTFYDSLLQYFAGTWNAYIATYQQQGSLVNKTFNDAVYPVEAAMLVAICGFGCGLYYFFFNNCFGNYYTGKKFLQFWLYSCIIVAVATWISVHSMVSGFTCPTAALVNWITCINLFFAAFCFFIFAMCCQGSAIFLRRAFHIDISVMGNRTPF